MTERLGDGELDLGGEDPFGIGPRTIRGKCSQCRKPFTRLVSRQATTSQFRLCDRCRRFREERARVTVHRFGQEA